MITSLQNETIKHLVKLRDKKYRLEHNEIIIDELKYIQIAINSKIKIKSVYYYLNEQPKSLSIPAFEVSQHVFNKISYGERNTGFVAIAEPTYLELKNINIKNNPLYIVLDNIEKPGNIGAILRTADAIKVNAVFVIDQKTDLFNPNIIRSSVGNCFSVPYLSVSIQEIEQFFLSNNISCYTLTPDGKHEYLGCDYKKPCAIIVGNEHDGVGNYWKNKNLKTVNIPMHGVSDSLNVSVAATVVMYEAYRQRKI